MLFRSLEEIQLLEPLNELHLYCLHYVFMPRISRSIDDFVGQWNNHPLRTEHGRSPRQLFEFPLVFSEGLAQRSFPDIDWTLYGIDDEAPGGSVDEEGEGITVPESSVVLRQSGWLVRSVGSIIPVTQSQTDRQTDRETEGDGEREGEREREREREREIWASCSITTINPTHQRVKSIVQ